MLPAFFGLKGPALTDEERDFFLSTDPAGYILFARNIETPEQVRRLTDALKDLHGREHLPILIDQEGGRVARLKPPHWSAHPPSHVYGQLYEKDEGGAQRAIEITGQVMAAELLALGITADCLPVLDVPQSDADPIIGDRAYALNPDGVRIMGRWAAQSLLDNGIVPVIKHIPGHGRALVDSHLSLPEVDASLDELRAVDFPPFRELSDMPMAMTAHVVYKAIDPDNCATLSKTIIQNIIREELAFDGLLMSDDLSMKALSGDFETRAKQAYDAGCDIILHCNGDMAEMQAIASALPSIDEKRQMRLQKAMLSATSTHRADKAEINALLEERARLLGLNKE